MNNHQASQTVKIDVVGLGTVVIDHLAVLADFPEVDSKNEMLTDRFQVGGPVPTALAVLSRFGKRTNFLGNWGDDAFGDMIEADFRREEIGIAGSMRRENSRTGFAHVWIDQATGTRTIACARPRAPLTVAEIDRDILQGCRLLYLDGWPEEAALRAAQIVKEAGGKVFLDTGSLKPGMELLIPHVDVLNCPRKFLQQQFGTDDIERGGETLLKRGPRIVTITDGERGATLFCGNEIIKQPAFEVTAIDTTGAGDVFSGAMAYAVLEEWPLERAVRFAAATAALKCAGLGNRDALPTLQEVRRFLAEGMIA